MAAPDVLDRAYEEMQARVRELKADINARTETLAGLNRELRRLEDAVTKLRPVVKGKH
jgi:chromosome segregation ATPase